jgi:hypothetical protein
MTRRLVLIVSADLDDHLRDVAKRDFTSKSAVVRLALRRYLRHTAPPGPVREPVYVE